MPIGLRLVYTSIARESDDSGGFLAGPWMVARVVIGTHHVPRRVPNDGGKASVGFALSGDIKEDLGEFELPMEEPMGVGRSFGDSQKMIGPFTRQHTLAHEDLVGQRREERCARSQLRLEPASAPEVGDSLPLRER